MREAEQIFQNLKRLMRSRGITYKALGKELGLSEPSIKRIFGQANLDVARVIKICHILDVNLAEVSGVTEDALPRRLTSTQEAGLVRDERLFVYFVLLSRQWTAKQIASEYRYSLADSARCLATLRKLALIELFPGDKVKMRVSEKIEWIPGGPIMQMYERIVTKDFFDYRFGVGGDRRAFLHWEVSPATLEILSRRLDALVKDFETIALADQALDKKHTRSVAFLAGLRPWILPVFERHKR